MSDTPPLDRSLAGAHDPEFIGPYRILERVGEGGMGVVYAAEQLEPVRRRVALKIVKAGLATPEVVTRFRTEREALTVMDHPGIARVLDAGVAEDGRPWVAMEFVSGLRIDRYCDKFRLTLNERVELVCALAEAVQHAHQKGVIHRDLKPSNVLVTEVDGKPVPKVIDFGIAKAVGTQAAGSPYVTSIGQAVGTLAYMSPEQAEGSGLDVDTRTDVYALGILLYQLLVGTVPVDPRTVGGPRFLAALIMPDHSFPSPKERFRGDTVTRAEVAKSRGLTTQELEKRLDGDLRWIVMKAIEKDRNRRYETANGMRLDLKRYLTDEPVIARPASIRYRVGKLVRRNRAASIAATIAFLIFVGGTVSTALGLRRAQLAEAEARAAESRAQTEADAARSVADFLSSLFDASRPGNVGANTNAGDLLALGAERIETELENQPLIQARLLTTIGAVSRTLGQRDQSSAQLRRAVDLFDREGVPNSGDLVVALREYGLTLRVIGEYQRAEEALDRAVALARERAQAGESSSGDHELAHTLLGRAGLSLALGRLDAAESMLQEALELERSDLDRVDRETGTIMSDLGLVALGRGEFLRASEYLEDAARMREQVLGARHPDLAGSLINLGAAFYYREQYPEALDAYRRAEEIYSEIMDPDHLFIANARNNIAEVHWKLGELGSAEEYFLEAAEIKSRALGPDNQLHGSTALGLANVYRDMGRWDDAEPYYRRAIQVYEVNFGPDSPRLREALQEWAEFLRATGRTEEAATVEDRLAALGTP